MGQEFDQDKLMAVIRAGDLKTAKEMIAGVREYRAAEMACFGVLESGETPPAELIEAVLQKFMDTHKDCTYKPNHGYWVHSLSHFTEYLWRLRLDHWIKEFNRVAFAGAIGFGDSNCSDRLIGDFASYSRWDDNPADFHLDSVNTLWMNWKHAGYAKVRIAAATFPSEADFLRWKLSQPEESQPRDYQYRDFGGKDAARLKELGGDVSQFTDTILAKLKEKLVVYEGNLARAQQEVDDTREVITKLS